MTVEQLELARMLAISGDYSGAIKQVDALLRVDCGNILALQLKGNVLELAALDTSRDISAAERSCLYKDARDCYELILKMDSSNTNAMRDLAGNMKNTGKIADSAKLYIKLIEILVVNISLGIELDDELNDVIDEYVDLIVIKT